MKIKEYIKREIKNGKRKFDFRFNANLEVKENALHRVRFKIKKSIIK